MTRKPHPNAQHAEVERLTKALSDLRATLASQVRATKETMVERDRYRTAIERALDVQFPRSQEHYIRCVYDVLCRALEDE